MISINIWPYTIYIRVINMNNNTFVHKYLSTLLHKEDVVVDMTLGNGNDTFFLASRVKHVYGFDIQKEAIINSKKRCQGFGNITYVLDNHLNFDKYIQEDVSLFIFNLGYLPKSNNQIITQADNSLKTLIKAYSFLKKGYIIISFYRGHKGGKDEFYLLDKYLSFNNIPIIEKYQEHKRFDEPLTYIIKKG